MFSQMDKKVAEELGGKNIRTKEQLQEILKKNNLTEEQARALAKQYGMDFDNFINTFLANDETKLKRSYSFFQLLKIR
jgi:antitoxin component HigA of HigAB toxin-antitoxin module